jgi:hypothetical protein
VAVSIGAGVDGGLAREAEGTASSAISTTPKSSLERGTGPNTNRATGVSPSRFRSIAWVRRPAKERAAAAEGEGPLSDQRRGLLVSKGWVQATFLVVLFGFLVLGILAYQT